MTSWGFLQVRVMEMTDTRRPPPILKSSSAPSVELRKAALIGYVRDCLLKWWPLNRREFPWRSETDPYRVLVAEILLRRTQAAQVVPVYIRFLREFPDLSSLAQGRPQQIRKLLRPLGLRWRAENVIKLRRVIAKKTGGGIPDSMELLGSLPGVGDYVAAAVRCFAKGEAVPVIDTNTARVVSRFFGIEGEGELRRNRAVRKLLSELAAGHHPREFNWALIDLAAQICRARVPLCSRCPLNEHCTRTGVARWL
jgi:A/G-specific adenine glycosylase